MGSNVLHSHTKQAQVISSSVLQWMRQFIVHGFWWIYVYFWWIPRNGMFGSQRKTIIAYNCFVKAKYFSQIIVLIKDKCHRKWKRNLFFSWNLETLGINYLFNCRHSESFALVYIMVITYIFSKISLKQKESISYSVDSNKWKRTISECQKYFSSLV